MERNVSEIMTRPRPTPQQLAWQRTRPLAHFCHFGINTFHAKEWSDGSLDPATFAPTALDCGQWAATAAAAGAAHIILTARHHDGFCLWPTQTTDYAVASSPFRDGDGDVVRELAGACQRHGLGLGLYLSPWDRHELTWASDPAAYDALYLTQLTELLTGYGPLVELWFEGAGSERHPYDWNRIMDAVERHQPDAMIFNMGRPTIRWVGNEDGLASDPCWYTVTATRDSLDAPGDTDLGEERLYLPPECDVPIRRNWFWQPDDLHTLKSLNHLQAIWYRSIGLGANLLLNVPPDRRGLLDDADVERLLDLTDTIRVRFARPIPATLTQHGATVTATFPPGTTFDHLILREDLTEGQRIRHHTIRDAATGKVIAQGHTIGAQRYHAFPRTATDRIEVTTDDPPARLDSLEAHHTGVESIADLEPQSATMREK